jgi:hypothetical protein
VLIVVLLLIIGFIIIYVVKIAEGLLPSSSECDELDLDLEPTAVIAANDETLTDCFCGQNSITEVTY